MSKNWLNGKTVIISGASGGLGFNIAKKLITKYDCKVIGIARNEQKMLASIQELGDKKSNFTYRLFDVNDSDKWIEFALYLKQNNVSPDVLINNAGFMLPFNKFENYTQKEINEIVSTNFMSHINAIKIIKPLLNNSSTPAIVNIISAAGLCPVVGQSMYCATKFGLKGFTDCLRLELGRDFYIAGVYPGFIKTDILNRMSISDKNNRLIEKLMKPVDKATNIIVRKISKKRNHIVLGVDGKSMNFMMRLFPKTAPKLIRSVLKASKLEMFDDVFNG